MNLLVVYSNHHSNNFNARLLDRIGIKARQMNWPMAVRDLYSINFDPVLRTQDFEMLSRGTPPEDIAKEQDFVRWAHVILFIYPVWWGGMPAIMKGYIDRVFSWGFAYGTGENGVYSLLNDKKAIIMNSLGQSSEEYEKGMYQAMSRINNEAVFGFCGIEVLHQMYFSSIHTVTPQQEAQYFNQAETALECIPVLQNN
jgi:NAD(P)H dehydrogenase (quinone)